MMFGARRAWRLVTDQYAAEVETAELNGLLDLPAAEGPDRWAGSRPRRRGCAWPRWGWWRGSPYPATTIKLVSTWGTGEGVAAELLPLLVSPEWVEERKARWDATRPIYQSKALGEFPNRSDDW
jgi:hypothetical protein